MLPNDVKHSEYLLFAHEFKLFKHISSCEYCNNLQTDLNSVFSNLQKCKCYYYLYYKCQVISLNRKLQLTYFHYAIDGLILSKIYGCRDLDIHPQTDQHYELIANKAFKLLGFVIRFKTILKIYKQLYNALDRHNI